MHDPHSPEIIILNIPVYFLLAFFFPRSYSIQLQTWIVLCIMFMELYIICVYGITQFYSVLLFLLNVVLYNLHGQSIYSKFFFMPTMDKYKRQDTRTQGLPDRHSSCSWYLTTDILIIYTWYICCALYMHTYICICIHTYIIYIVVHARYRKGSANYME